MRTKTLTLHDSNGDTLVSLLVQELGEVLEAPVRNLEGVQPPASNAQGVFGDGLHTIGVLSRPVSLCDMSSYGSVFAAKAALEVALRQTASVRVDGWELPIAASRGISSWRSLLTELRATIELIPASAHWRQLSTVDTGTGSQSGATLTLESLTSTDVGRLVVFADGREALITAVASATSATADVDQTVSSQGFELFTVATGLI